MSCASAIAIIIFSSLFPNLIFSSLKIGNGIEKHVQSVAEMKHEFSFNFLLFTRYDYVNLSMIFLEIFI